MKIVTFGSCLSRYTANHYVRLFGGKIISSVYHNRSDAFIGKFIDKNWKMPEFEKLANSLQIREDSDADNLPINILKNQYESTIGLHRLSKGIPFFKALEEQQPELIIMDNYMDLAAKLILIENYDGIFLKLGDAIKNEKWQTLDYLSPEKSIKNMTKVVNFFKLKCPNSRIIFINFPHNTYEGSIDRINRTKEFEQGFSHPQIDIIPCLNVHPNFQTHQKQHFKGQQYSGYAGIIYQTLLQNS